MPMSVVTLTSTESAVAKPLPPQAHEEVLRLLNDAVEQQGAVPAAGEEAADVPEAAQQAAASPDAEVQDAIRQLKERGR